jgi:NADPH:quinone reductase-like Zn-dependent oxidoreductase
LLTQIAAMIGSGQVTRHVDRVLPLDDAAEAERRLQQEHVGGKLALQVA